ncbi:hypothetical protein [uncultured Oscillibacter sp.]|uniref:hypothetical protein n=2 Tax=uncultured Oscillibacter sp. TaxID=876091 RepID=UPI0025D40DE0|nr:hypothetical protein [uncultured Oscillibacter sp.]
MGTAGTVRVVFEDTPEKFRTMAEGIVPPLIELLRGLCALEEKFYARGQKQRAERPGGIYSTQAHPNSKALWGYYREAYKALLDPRCTEKLLAQRRDCCQSMGDPADFACLKGPAEVVFTMKSKGKAVVMVRDCDGFGSDCRFELKPEGGGWKIHQVSRNTCGGGPWRTDLYF